MASELGTYYISIWPNMSGVSTKVTSALSGIDTTSVGNSMGGKMGNGVQGGLSTAKVAIGNVLANVASAGINAIRNDLDSAISRVDTLNQFPKVLQQMGFSAEECDASMSKMSQGIEGLPTTLDEITSNTQTLALTTGDLDYATDSALALNDAFLASGASTDAASRGMTQYVQMLASGKVDAQSWNSVVQNMNYAMNEVSESMGYGTIQSGALYSALQSGEVTMDDVTNCLIDLDQQQGGLADTAQAASTGIATSFDNMNNAVIKNMANIIQEIDGDEHRISAAFDGIKNAINTVGGFITDLVGQVIEWIDTSGVGQAACDAFSAAFDVVSSVVSAVGSVLPSVNDTLNFLLPILEAAAGAATGFGIAMAIEPTINAVKSAISGFQGILATAQLGFESFTAATKAGEGAQWAFNAVLGANPLMKIVTIIIMVVGALVTFIATNEDARNAIVGFFTSVGEWISTVWDALVSFFTGICDTIVDVFTVQIPQAFNDFITFFANLPGQILEFITSIIESIVSWKDEMVQNALDAGQQFFDNVVNFFANLPGEIWNWLSEFINNVRNWEIEIVQDALQAASDFFNNVVTWISQLPGQIWSFLSTIISNVASWGSTIVSNAISAASSFLSNVVSYISQLPGNIASFLSSVISNVVSWGSSMVSNAISSMTSFVNNIINKIKGLPNKFAEIAGNIITGFVNGIMSGISQVTGAIGNLVSSAIEKGKSLLGIGSPSKVFASIGDYTMQGMEEGIEKGAVGAQNALEDAIDDMKSSAKMLDLSEEFDSNIDAGMKSLSNGVKETKIYQFGDINIEAKDLKDATTIDQVIDVIKQASRMGGVA